MFLYIISLDKWYCFHSLGLPALSGHKMVKGKNNKCIYMFGGLNSKGKATNKMYKIKNVNIEGN
jgi:hypothetical protein